MAKRFIKTQKKKSVNTTRISAKELQEAIFVPRKEEQEVQQESKREVIVFTIAGQHDEFTDETGTPDTNGYPSLWDIEYDDGDTSKAEDEENAYAKTAYNQGRRRFYIKENRSRRLMNPISSISNETKNKRYDKTKFTYREVGHLAFMLYLKFLKTKNNAYLLQAEREVM